MKEREVYIGTSGWSYKHWKGIFYPEKLAAARYLSFYAGHFPVTEINSSFYHLPRATTVEKWQHDVPRGFLFCPKISRFISHMKKLHDAAEPLERFFDIFAPMHAHMGPVLIQLPASVPFQKEVAEPFFALLKSQYRDFRFALEVRHDSWFEEESEYLMKQYGITLVFAHSARFPYCEIFTAPDIYVRFHGPSSLYGSSYSDEFLRDYAGKINAWRRDGHTVWVFFNNDINADALYNARTLQEIVDGFKAEK